MIVRRPYDLTRRLRAYRIEDRRHNETVTLGFTSHGAELSRLIPHHDEAA